MNEKITLQALAQLTGSTLIGSSECVITGVADIESATPHEATFLANAKYNKLLHSTQAGVIFIDPQTEKIEGKNFLVSENPSSAFQKVVEFFFKGRNVQTGFSGIHKTAVIHPTAKLAANVQVGPLAVIDAEVTIEEGTTIGASVFIGPNVTIGKECHIYPHVTVRERCTIGSRVIIQPGVVIGSCGFGYITDKLGNHIKLKQVGTVTIEDDVEIGANVCIDRSRFQTTRIGKGSKIDNLVQIAHGVEIGPANLIVAQTGIAGSTKTGKYVIMAGQAAVAGHITLADGVILSAKTGVSKSLLNAGKYGGTPAQPLADYNKNQVLVRRLGKLYEKVEALEKKIQQEPS